MTNEADQAVAEEEQAHARTSQAMGRPRVLIQGKNDTRDMTEQVVSVLESLYYSMDWGSGFLDENQVRAAEDLGEALGFKREG